MDVDTSQNYAKKDIVSKPSSEEIPSNSSDQELNLSERNKNQNGCETTKAEFETHQSQYHLKLNIKPCRVNIKKAPPSYSSNQELKFNAGNTNKNDCKTPKEDFETHQTQPNPEMNTKLPKTPNK